MRAAIERPARTDTPKRPRAQCAFGRLLQLRDQIAPQYQMQLDEIARGLVSMFAETDQTGAGPNQTGLFGWAGSPAVPGTGVTAGLAGTIKVSSAFVASEGGSSLLLRDGGANGANYKYNTTGAAGFSDRLRALNEAFTEPLTFASSAGLNSSASLIDYSASSISWLEGKRKTANSNFSYNQTVAVQADQALSNANGVDINTEMALLLDLEHSYQASSRVLTTINSMLDDLLNAV